jgi:hypothetical protein
MALSGSVLGQFETANSKVGHPEYRHFRRERIFFNSHRKIPRRGSADARNDYAAEFSN